MTTAKSNDFIWGKMLRLLVSIFINKISLRPVPVTRYGADRAARREGGGQVAISTGTD